MQVVADRYEIESELGRGGMGVVYLATDSKLGRRVALKQLALSEVGTGSDEAVRRFMREARVMGSLLHPAIVILYDVLEEEDDLYLVMEYYPSRNLSEVVADRGSLGEEEVRHIGARLSSGLAAAHAKGIIHRDVKPENVLIGDDGAKLTDFGVARITEGVRQQVTKLTQSGYYVGTPGYMAPEVIKGGDAVTESDTFSLGLLLYYALTGTEPYTATDVASLLYQIVYEPLDLASLQISGDLREIIERATAKDPADRPTASELRQLLEGERRLSASGSAADSAPEAMVSPAPSQPLATSPYPGAMQVNQEASPQEVTQPASYPQASPSDSGPHAPVVPTPQQQAPASVPPPQQQAPAITPQPQAVPAAAVPPPTHQPYYVERPKKDTRVVSLLIGLVLGSLIVFGLIALAVVATRPARRTADGQQNPPAGFQIHNSQLGYRATIPGPWTTQVDAASSSEFLWSPGQEAGIVVANLGAADPSIYSLKSQELVDKVKSDLTLGEGYSIDERGLEADPNANFGASRAAKVNLEITGPPGKPRYKAELYFFNKSEKMWAVMTLARRVTYESYRPAFSEFERTFEVAS
jgi:serine/threonine protein kinase